MGVHVSKCTVLRGDPSSNLNKFHSLFLYSGCIYCVFPTVSLYYCIVLNNTTNHNLFPYCHLLKVICLKS